MAIIPHLPFNIELVLRLASTTELMLTIDCRFLFLSNYIKKRKNAFKTKPTQANNKE